MGQYGGTYRNVDQALPALIKQLQAAGIESESRVGKVKELYNVHITLTHPREREILLPVRKANLAAQIAETMWVLDGRNDIEWLKRYLPRAPEFSDNGVVWRGAYGPRIRNWPSLNGPIDQLAHVVRLLKEDPNTRRAVIQIYDPAVDTFPGKDIPCNDLLIFSLRKGRLDLYVTVRSNDVMWGWSGINAFEWSSLQEVVARLVGVSVGFLHFSIVNLHLYERHWEKASRIADLTPDRTTRHATLSLSNGYSVDIFDQLVERWFEVEDRIYNGTDNPQDIAEFPDTLLRSWLRIIKWWWSGKPNNGIVDTRLNVAMSKSLQPKVFPTEKGSSDFIKYVCKLHEEKHAAYGDSWKRRGEMLGIMANIARKIDRLGKNGAGETAADTAIDLLVYLAKYRWWLFSRLWGCPLPRRITPLEKGIDPTELCGPTNDLLRAIDKDLSVPQFFNTTVAESRLTKEFDELESRVTSNYQQRWKTVDYMIEEAYCLAKTLWEKENEYRGADVD